jgi:topoisomerase IA-like protein
MRSRLVTLSMALFLLSSGVAFGASKTKKKATSAHKTHHSMTHNKKANKKK